jgi:hypothetical protein
MSVAPPPLPRRGSLSHIPLDEIDAQKACMVASCEIRGLVSENLRKNNEAWSDTSWMRKFELVKAEEAKRRNPLPGNQRRMSALGMIALGLQSMHQPAAGSLQISRLRKFRLFAKKALWKHRKEELSQRTSLWWCIETHRRVIKCRQFFEGINKGQAFERARLFDPENHLHALISSLPMHAICPSAQDNRAASDDVAAGTNDGPAGGSDDADKTLMPPFMIHPHSPFRSSWDVCLLVLLLYCVYSVPYQMSFSSDIPMYYVAPNSDEIGDTAASTSGVLDYIDLFTDIVFMTDVCINFRTAFLRPHATRSMVLETRGRVIAVRYIKTSFLTDVVSSLPIQYMSPLISEAVGFSKVPRLFKLIRLLRLIKFFRVNRVKRTASTFKDSVGMSHAVYRGLSFVIVFFFTVHTIACALYFVGTLYFRDPNG